MWMARRVREQWRRRRRHASASPGSHLVLIDDQALKLVVPTAMQGLCLHQVPDVHVLQASRLRNLLAERGLAGAGSAAYQDVGSRARHAAQRQAPNFRRAKFLAVATACGRHGQLCRFSMHLSRGLVRVSATLRNRQGGGGWRASAACLLSPPMCSEAFEGRWPGLVVTVS